MSLSPKILIHGGAGIMRGHDYRRPAALMTEILAEGQQALRDGRSARELVLQMVMRMEESGLFNAGKGGMTNAAGDVELDASIMTGDDQQAGAVAIVRNVKYPVLLADAVMRKTPHVLLAGAGAAEFARAEGLELIPDPKQYYRAAVELTRKKGVDAAADSSLHGTVGAVALDRAGRLAAATSTGGTRGKMHGRVGDTPLIGAGTWADQTVAVSGTGLGEYFIRTALARDVAARMAYQGTSLTDAAEAALAALGALGGDGGLIAVDREGNFAMPFNSEGMKRGVVGIAGDPEIFIY